MKSKILHIINRYGIKHQLKKFIEESYELIEAINDYENIYWSIPELTSKDHIEEELADVLVVLYQIKELYGLDKENINAIMKYKIDRTIERIKEEK